MKDLGATCCSMDDAARQLPLPLTSVRCSSHIARHQNEAIWRSAEHPGAETPELYLLAH